MRSCRLLVVIPLGAFALTSVGWADVFSEDFQSATIASYGNNSVIDGTDVNTGWEVSGPGLAAVIDASGNNFCQVSNSYLARMQVYHDAFLAAGSYALSFDIEDPSTSLSGIYIEVFPSQGGAPIIDDYFSTLSTTFTTETLSFNIASNAAGTFQFRFSNSSNGNDAVNPTDLDNIHLRTEQAPEPFTMTLGLAGAGLFIRRRMKR